MISRHLIAKFLTPGLGKFRDRHKGETCYLFGDGPSIKWFDLGLFCDHPAFCCGMLPFHRDFHKLDVRYVSMVEPWFFTPKRFQPDLLWELEGVIAEYAKLVRRTSEKRFFMNVSNAPFFHASNITHVFRGYPTNRNQSDRDLGRFDLFAGSFHASLALAHYMGFTRIYLVGFDAFTLDPIRNIRWYEHGEGDEFPGRPGIEEDFLGIISRQAELFTIGHRARSGNVQYIDYAAHTGAKPVFHENNELTDDRLLRLLAACSEYQIFPEGAPQSSRASHPTPVA
jgi:hypothetical protein